MQFPSVCSANETPYTTSLMALGILKGDGTEGSFSRAPTRAEALVMLLRLLGLEKEADRENYSSPFADSGWADKYIGYAYEKGLVSGISDTLFGSNYPVTTQQYCTFLLRALGYSDGEDGQFKYENAKEFATIVLSQNEIADSFTRGDMAKLSWLSLKSRCYGKTQTLADMLIQKNVFTGSQFNAAKLICDKAQKEIKNTTILIYMVGSDLESLQGRATNDLKEIINAPKSENLNVIIFAGGTKSWRNEWMINNKNCILEVGENELKQLDNPNENQITYSDTLTQFINFGKDNYPADRYVLDFWDHGDGTLGGFGRDELNNNRTMRLNDIRNGISNSGVHFDVILFDACLMGTFETAYALENSADIMIASEDLTPADGIYYSTWLNALAARPNISTENLSNLIVESFRVHNVSQPGLQVTMSAIRLDRMDELYNRILKMMSGITDEKLTSILKARDTLSAMGARDGGFDQFDIVKFAEVSGLDGSSEVVVATQSAVYYLATDIPTKTSGLAIYIPRNHLQKYEIVRNDLEKCGFEGLYLSLLDKFNSG